jgi:hypothetical protein
LTGMSERTSRIKRSIGVSFEEAQTVFFDPLLKWPKTRTSKKIVLLRSVIARFIGFCWSSIASGKAVP